MEDLLKGPDKLENIYIHRKHKDYVTAVITRDATGAIACQCLISKNGFNGVPSTTGIFASSALPKPADNIYVTAVALSKYLLKNGYKVVNTITQTKNGTKLS